MAKINTHKYLVTAGKYKGHLITRVPAKALTSMCTSVEASEELQMMAEAELGRRNSYVPKDVILSGHSIDQASLRLANLWKARRKKAEGIFSWLGKFAEKALLKGTNIKDDQYAYKGAVFVFSRVGGDTVPVLKTVMENSKGKK